jgi:hypothetical protein
MNLLVRRIVVGASALGLLAVTGCSIANTRPDLQAVHYKGGSFSSQTFADCIKPSDRQVDGPGDTHYYYPIGQRTLSFTGRDKSEAGPVTIKTKDSQEMAVLGFVAFELTSDCETLRRFHEQVGLKYGAYFEEDQSDSAGWLSFLSDYMLVPLNSVMDKAGLQQNWQTLYSSPEALGEFEDFVVTNLPAEVERAIGSADFIKIKSISIETPQPSEGLRKSLEQIEAAKAQKRVQDQQNEVAKSKYANVEECKKVYSEQSCLTLDLADRGGIQFYPQGSNLNVAPR